MAELLVVGEETDSLLRLGELLELAGHRVHRVADQEEAQDLLRTGFLNAVFCSLHLRQGNSFELIEEAAGGTFPTPVVIVSDFSETARSAEAFAAGARDYLPLPVDPQELSLCLQRIIARQAPRPSLEGIRFEANDGIFIIHFPSEVLYETAFALQQLLDSGLKQPEHGLVISLEKTEHICSTGISILFLLAKTFSALDGHFYICRVSTRIRKVLSMAGIDAVYLFAEQVSDAVSLLQRKTSSNCQKTA